ncbi:MAG: hypothetical protein U5J78_03415 [Parasphingorhabdus sp.]|nr:hypothetical protein [Parasphingorhabdus sp.]
MEICDGCMPCAAARRRRCSPGEPGGEAVGDHHDGMVALLGDVGEGGGSASFLTGK